jgi:Ser/Thr protein kinase RdoA (MazF antagonist)
MECILNHWIGDPETASIEPAPNGLSGARVWRVNYRGQSFALRRWQDGFSPQRLQGIHLLQHWLARDAQPVPQLLRASATAQTVVDAEDALWELATWMPGVADFRHRPNPVRLHAGMQALARLHLSAARMPATAPDWVSSQRVSPALMRRSENLCKIGLMGLREIGSGWGEKLPAAEYELLAEAATLVGQTAEAELNKSQRWESESLPLQFCLRDVTHQHVLFTGDEVTGLIDFGAAAYDCAAGDVARLLGSMIDDDRSAWRLGIESYAAVRPLTDAERDVISYFDSSGVVLSTYNWIKWLLKAAAGEKVAWDRPQALARFQHLVQRLRVLASK